MNQKIKRLASLVVAPVLLLGSVSIASARESGCRDSHHERKGAMFERADRNKDGFLTRTEVGPKRWERLQHADVNRDRRVSRAEFERAERARVHDAQARDARPAERGRRG